MMKTISFNDTLSFDPKTRAVVSLRDGIHEYYGHEIGEQPADKLFKVFRARETVQDVVGQLPNLPVTLGHVAMTAAIADNLVCGKIIDSKFEDHEDPESQITCKVKNVVDLYRDVVDNELSLGYFADLVPCEKYDFEQVNITAHHLATVPAGRCGSTCSFTDGKGDQEMKRKTNKVFLDEEGNISMEQVMSLLADLPDAIKGMDLAELQKLVPVLQEILGMAKVEEDKEGGDADAPVEDEEPKEKDEEEEKKEITDSAVFKDALASAVKNYAEVVGKAREFLPENYKFADKTATQIMTAAVATQYKDKFNDAELSTAFKMLKKPAADYRNFGDSQAAGLASLKDKEI